MNFSAQEVSGFVLTGGLSSRMGQDKALLSVGSQTLCEQIGDVVRSVAERVTLVGHPERYGHLKYGCVADVRPGLGPLSGIETALHESGPKLRLIVSCDAYNMDPEWLRLLVSEAESSGALCVVAQDSAGQLQPLCGVYHRDCLSLVSRALDERRLRAMDLLEELDARPVRVNGMVLNLNTLEQYRETMNADRGK